MAAEVEGEVGGLVRHREARQAMEDQARAGGPPAGALDLDDRGHHARGNAFAGLGRREGLGVTDATLARRADGRRALELAIAGPAFPRRQREPESVERRDARIGEGRRCLRPRHAVGGEPVDQVAPAVRGRDRFVSAHVGSYGACHEHDEEE